MTRFVDTNVFLRLLAGDDAEQSPASRRLFERATARKERLATSSLVVAELVWTLESYFELDRKAVREKIELLLNTPGIKVEHSDWIQEAISFYEEKNVDYVDAYNAVFSRELGLDAVYSWDRDFDRLPGITRLEPP